MQTSRPPRSFLPASSQLWPSSYPGGPGRSPSVPGLPLARLPVLPDQHMQRSVEHEELDRARPNLLTGQPAGAGVGG